MSRPRPRSLHSVATLLLLGLAIGCQAAPSNTGRVVDTDTLPTTVQLPDEARREAGIAIVAAQPRSIERVIRTTGFVAPDQDRIAHLRPLARGVVEEVFVRLGDRVVAGQRLVTYDNIELGELIGQYRELTAGRRRLEARRNVAEKFLRRGEALIEVEAISRSDFELRQAEYEQAVADVRSQEASMARVEEKLHRFGLGDTEIGGLASNEHSVHRTASHSTLRAPFAGIVTRYDVSQGEVVDRDDELFTIVDTSRVWVLADLYEKDLGLLRGATTARIDVPAYPGRSFLGDIEYVADFLDPESRTAKVRCVVANDDGRLKLEMYAAVQIPVVLGDAVTAVPVGALQEIEGTLVVFVEQGNGGFSPRPVRLGLRGDGWVEVVEGLDPGDQVVAQGAFYLKSAVLRASIGEEE